jgi:hypothetical protein
MPQVLNKFGTGSPANSDFWHFDIVKHHDGYHMASSYTPEGATGGAEHVYFLWSTDGVSWSICENPLFITGVNGHKPYKPTIVPVAGANGLEYRCWYTYEKYPHWFMTEGRIFVQKIEKSQDSNNLIFYFPFEDASGGAGTYTKDWSKNGFSGLLGGSLSGASHVSMRVGKGLVFNHATSDIVTVPYNALFNTWPMTVIFNMASNTTTTPNTMVGTYVSGSSNGWRVGFTSSGLQAWYYRSAAHAVAVNAGNNLFCGRECQLAFVCDATGGYLYINGSLLSSATWIGTPQASTATADLVIGRYPTGGTYYNGRIDEVKMYNYALTADEVRSHFERTFLRREHTVTAAVEHNLLWQNTSGLTGATLTGGGGTAITDTDTFDGYTIGQVVTALKNTKILE